MEDSQDRHTKKTLRMRRQLIDIKHIIYAHKHQSDTEW